jgi:hypothetical protein
MTKPPTICRVRFLTDPDAQFEECNGEPRPLTEAEYAENQYFSDTADPPTPVPYAEYLAYHGNPERHVYLSCEVQTQCPCCQQWTRWAGGLHGIDFMDDSPELQACGRYWMQEKNRDWFTPEQCLELPGYLREVSTDTLLDAGWAPPPEVYCQRKRCRYWHIIPRNPLDDKRYCQFHQTASNRRHLHP